MRYDRWDRWKKKEKKRSENSERERRVDHGIAWWARRNWYTWRFWKRRNREKKRGVLILVLKECTNEIESFGLMSIFEWELRFAGGLTRPRLLRFGGLFGGSSGLVTISQDRGSSGSVGIFEWELRFDGGLTRPGLLRFGGLFDESSGLVAISPDRDSSGLVSFFLVHCQYHIKECKNKVFKLSQLFLFLPSVYLPQHPGFATSCRIWEKTASPSHRVIIGEFFLYRARCGIDVAAPVAEMLSSSTPFFHRRIYPGPRCQCCKTVWYIVCRPRYQCCKTVVILSLVCAVFLWCLCGDWLVLTLARRERGWSK